MDEKDKKIEELESALQMDAEKIKELEEQLKEEKQKSQDLYDAMDKAYDILRGAL